MQVVEESWQEDTPQAGLPFSKILREAAIPGDDLRTDQENPLGL
jgi:hypothetical protein